MWPTNLAWAKGPSNASTVPSWGSWSARTLGGWGQTCAGKPHVNGWHIQETGGPCDIQTLRVTHVSVVANNGVNTNCWTSNTHGHATPQISPESASEPIARKHAAHPRRMVCYIRQYHCTCIKPSCLRTLSSIWNHTSIGSWQIKNWNFNVSLWCKIAWIFWEGITTGDFHINKPCGSVQWG